MHVGRKPMPMTTQLMTRPTTRKRILVITGAFYPAYRTGGPPRAVTNLVRQLSDSFDFRVITIDHDLGEKMDVEPNQWCEAFGVPVFYQSFPQWSMVHLRQLIRENPHDLLYLSGYHDRWHSLAPLWLRQTRRIERTPVVVAPRGELAEGSRHVGGRMKSLKKWGYRQLANALGLYRDVVFHVTSPNEASDVRQLYPKNRQVYAPDLVDETVPMVAPHRKLPGTLRLVWLGRVAPIKRFDEALSLLTELDAPIRFDVYGPMDGDQAYRLKCEQWLRNMPKNVTVEMHGPIPYEQTATAFTDADFFILPTRNENFGHSIIEAMRYGCPVIISDTTCRRHLAEIGAGWDLPDQRKRWLEVLRQCINMDDATYQRHRIAARKYAEQQVDGTKIVDENIQMLMEAMENTR